MLAQEMEDGRHRVPWVRGEVLVPEAKRSVRPMPEKPCQQVEGIPLTGERYEAGQAPRGARPVQLVVTPHREGDGPYVPDQVHNVELDTGDVAEHVAIPRQLRRIDDDARARHVLDSPIKPGERAQELLRIFVTRLPPLIPAKPQQMAMANDVGMAAQERFDRRL